MKNLWDKVKGAVKKVGKVAGKTATAVVIYAGLSKSADAGLIEIRNITTAPGVGITTWNAKNITGATEGYGFGDGSFISPVQTNALIINSLVDENLLSTDARSTDTYGFDFNLGIKGTVNDISNILAYRVTDATDLISPSITLNGTTTPLIMDGSYYTISLPNVSGTNTNYGTGYLQLKEAESPVVPEPSGLALMLAGAAALARKKTRDGTNPGRK